MMEQEGGHGSDIPADDELRDEIRELEENPPKRLEDWPKGRAKYVTFGGPEGDHSYEEGPERKLGPSGVRYHEDGTVTVDGEQVDDPERFKGDPIPGGPTDPDAGGDPLPRPDTDRAKTRSGG
jgi:hypothetical protein